MMTLQTAASFFDDQLFTDTFGSATFYGQVLPFTDSVRSGSSTRRRILEVAADVTMPTKYTITEASNQVYLVSAGNEDYYAGDVIRVKYPVVAADNTFAVRTVGEILAGSGGTTGVYAVPSYVRREAIDDQSEHSSNYSVYFSPYYSVTAGKIIYGGGKYYRTKEDSKVEDVGFTVVESIEISDPISSVTVQQKTGALNPTTDAFTSSTPLTGISVFTEYLKLNYQHEALGYVRLEAGDKAISFLKTAVATINVGDIVGDYLVKAISDETTFWTIHGRKI